MKAGKLYNRTDFCPNYFTNNHFCFYNKLGEGCFVMFPMYMHSYVKFSPHSYDSAGKKNDVRSFTETLFIKIVKSHSDTS